MEIKYYAVAIFSGILSALSQVLLKVGSTRSVEKKPKSILHEYLNPFVLVGYGITFACMLLMIYAYRGIPYKVGPALETLVYLYVMVFSYLLWKEKITVKRFFGNLLICLGVIVFNLK